MRGGKKLIRVVVSDVVCGCRISSALSLSIYTGSAHARPPQKSLFNPILLVPLFFLPFSLHFVRSVIHPISHPKVPAIPSIPPSAVSASVSMRGDGGTVDGRTRTPLIGRLH